MQKLKKLGIDGPLLDWIRFYLQNHSQVTKVNQTFPQPLDIRCGILQGSVLGRLLFLLYMNDLACICTIYTDDCTCIFNADSIAEAIDTASKALKLIAQWFQVNKLSLNVMKTKAIAFCTTVYDPQEYPAIQVDGESI